MCLLWAYITNLIFRCVWKWYGVLPSYGKLKREYGDKALDGKGKDFLRQTQIFRDRTVEAHHICRSLQLVLFRWARECSEALVAWWGSSMEVPAQWSTAQSIWRPPRALLRWRNSRPRQVSRQHQRVATGGFSCCSNGIKSPFNSLVQAQYQQIWQ